MIITVVVLIAAGLTAWFVFPPKHRILTSGPTAASTAYGQRASAALVAKAAVSFDDVSITPAPAWMAVRQDNGSVILNNDDDTANMLVVVQQSSARNVTQLLPGFIQSATKSLTNVAIEKASNPKQLVSLHFQQEQFARFTGDLSTHQGTSPLYGIAVALLNTSTGEAALIDLFTTGSDLRDSVWPDAETMIGSML
ncbi:hypothetical protein [Mycobacterium sp. 852014-50255_SCH5639931]|uniref:hypothetical protein n=1 Tax=Mycobacterium sp. 852014-50255_SCH5639931 TaxID=1834112 RepID=UPI0007FE29E2|nr:hypothetical protein [Mycobacterium sp. 852014-50255_SCH5639931]OBB64889.1 hypothetical protein A5758_19890 [Mycobacterium sp. 852014-50255_SCH5639931]